MAVHNILFVGDSITSFTQGPPPDLSPPRYTNDAIAAALNETVSYVNWGVGGSSTADWLAGSTNYLQAASAGSACEHVMIMLGPNDCHVNFGHTREEFHDNLANTCAGFIGLGKRVWLNKSTYCDWDIGLPGDPLLVQYAEEIDDLANGTTIMSGDDQAYAYFLAHPELRPDGSHPSAAGNVHLGGFWAAPYILEHAPRIRRPKVRSLGGRLKIV